MLINDITIDHTRYHVVLTDIHHDCERCKLENKGYPKCSVICDSIARLNDAFSVRFEKMNQDD